MKKYRLTKIRIKTREIISVVNHAETESSSAVCPVCHTPLGIELASAEKTVKQLLPAEKADEDETSLTQINDFLEQKIK